MFRNGKFQAMMTGANLLVDRLCRGKIDSKAYSEFIPTALAEAAPAFKGLLPHAIIGDGVNSLGKKLKPLLAIVSQLKD